MVRLHEFGYDHDGLRLNGHLASPDGPGPHPAVLVLHSALGIDDDACRRAADLAALGYVALAADMYGKGRDLDREQMGRSFVELQTDPGLLRARVVAAFDVVRAVAGVDPARVSALGFCFGGQCALELARSGAAIRAAVSFHGLLRTANPACSGEVTAKVLSISGAKDPFVPAEDVAVFQREMADADVDWQMTVYGQGYHAFAMSDIAAHGVDGAVYDPFLDHLSWAQATAFLAAADRGVPVP